MKSRKSRGFTLIELLVVIAIIALLISILLPAVGKMKKVGWMTKSRANLRSICTAAAAYSSDQKGFYPISAPPSPAVRGMALEFNPQTGAPLNIAGWCTWTFGGKDCRGFWVGSTGGLFDIEAADRPLNPYVTDAAIGAPDPGQPYSSNNPERLADKLPVFKDPSDKQGHQENWPGPDTNIDPLLGRYPSAYESVGTSYQYNAKWHEFLMSPPPGSGRPALAFTKAFWTGCRMIRASDTFSPSRFCWVHDEYADIVVYNSDPNYKIKNGYGDVNRSIMGFMDGHVNYLETYPGRHQNPVGGIGQSYSNGMYTFVFDGYR
ncbi:MAG: prepilin-type N-terminal cleavage/methylation domain-containing protein [Phycisphaerales bacterium]